MTTWPLCSLGKTLLAFALLHFVLQDQSCLLLQVSLDFLFLHSSPPWWKGHLFRVLVLERLVGLHRTIELQLFLALVVGALTWITVILSSLAWKRTEIILLLLRLYLSTAFQTLVDYEGYSISSKGFLPLDSPILVHFSSLIPKMSVFFSLWLCLFILSLWLCLFILSGVISSLISSNILGTYQPGKFIFQCLIFLPFHTVHGALKARILKWFAIPFSSEPCFSRILQHDPSILGGPTWHG